jgi:hypothetical protein
MEQRYAAWCGFVLIAGTVGVWWFVFPEFPEVAVGDGLLAGAIASVLTGMFARPA